MQQVDDVAIIRIRINPEFSHTERQLAVDRLLLRKEVIQPQVPLRLPCYDFIPVIDHTLGGFFLCRLDHRFRVQSTPMM